MMAMVKYMMYFGGSALVRNPKLVRADEPWTL